MISLLLVLFVIALLCACSILGYVVYSYFEIDEEFAKMTPDEIFMFHFREIQRNKKTK